MPQFFAASCTGHTACVANDRDFAFCLHLAYASPTLLPLSKSRLDERSPTAPPTGAFGHVEQLLSYAVYTAPGAIIERTPMSYLRKRSAFDTYPLFAGKLEGFRGNGIRRINM
jgi:hypothetical protein